MKNIVLLVIAVLSLSLLNSCEQAGLKPEPMIESNQVLDQSGLNATLSEYEPMDVQDEAILEQVTAPVASAAPVAAPEALEA